MKKAIEAVLAQPWAIIPEWLDTIASIAERESEYHGNLEALQAKLGRPLGNTMTASLRDGVAILPVEGPLFRYANMFTEFSGATSYEVLARDFAAAEDDPMVQAHLLVFDTPGGQTNGAGELAKMVEAAKKPVWAYVSNMAASAGYWIASAADKIIAADTAMVGSIGAQAGVVVRDPRPGEKAYRFVSSQSPRKNADISTAEGASEMQAIVDGLAQVFIEDVARNRAISADDVIASYGQGSVFIASEAVKRGMVDAIGTFEGTLNSLKQELESMDYSKLTVAVLTENRPDLVAEITSAALAGVEKPNLDAIRADAREAERKRIADIEALAMPGTEELVAKFKADGTEPSAAAVEILKAAKAGLPQAQADKGAAHVAGLKKTEADIDPPKAGSGDDKEQTNEEAASAAIELARKAGIEA